MTTKPNAAQRAKRAIDVNTYGGSEDDARRREIHVPIKEKFGPNAMALDAVRLQQNIAAAITDERQDVLDGVRKVLLTVLDSFDGQPVKKEAITYALTLLSAMFSDFDWAGRTKTQQGVASGAATSMTPLDTSEDVRQARLKTLRQIANLVTLHGHNNKDKMGTAMHGEEEAYYKGHMHAAQILRGMLDSMIIEATHISPVIGQTAREMVMAAASQPSTGTEPAFKITIPK